MSISTALINNKGKGGKNKRRCKKNNNENQRELILKEKDQVYGQVIKILGGGRMEVKCFDNETRTCVIRGKMNKRNWISVGDIILVSLREYQDKTGDIIGKYTLTEARALKQLGEIPDIVETKNTDNKEEDDTFVFEDI